MAPPARLRRLAEHTRTGTVAAEGADVATSTELAYPDAALERVAGAEPSIVVPLSFFDYESWDKVTKPASFNMTLPEGMEDEAALHMSARRTHLVDTAVYDGRPYAGSFSLDTSGLVMRHVPTSMDGEDFYAIEKVHQKYFPECVEFVKQMTGATAVLPFDHSVRNKVREGDPAYPGVSSPVSGAHNDNTLASGPNRARQLLKPVPEVEAILSHRYAVMNVWRRWDGGNDMPLAVCSGDSLAPDNSDMQGSDLVYENRTGEIYSAINNPNQTFFWFSDMQKDEAIILKIYDSDSVGETVGAGPVPTAKWTLHTAFDHPGHSLAQGTAPGPRESCEVRCLVLWAPEPLVAKAELRGVTGLAGGDTFYDPKTGEYVKEKDGESAVMREGYDGSRSDIYAKFRQGGVSK